MSKKLGKKNICIISPHSMWARTAGSWKTDIFMGYAKKQKKKECHEKAYFSTKTCTFYRGHIKITNFGTKIHKKSFLSSQNHFIDM
jgi:hypothetical protein